MTIVNELDLGHLTLKRGSHNENAERDMCIMEAVAFVAGEPWGDHPKCASPVLAAIMRRWNDDLNDEDRQSLKPYVLRLVGSRGSQEIEDKRGWMATDWLVHSWLPLWLRAAGMEDQAQACEALAPVTSPSTSSEAQDAIRTIRDAAWARRNEVWKPWREKFVAKLREELAKRGLSAAAVAVAVADAAADAAAAAAAAAAAVAVADADAAAVAVAVADAAADAAADADARKLSYYAAYWAVRGAIYETVKAKVAEILNEKHSGIVTSTKQSASDLIEAMFALTENRDVTDVEDGSATESQAI